MKTKPTNFVQKNNFKDQCQNHLANLWAKYFETRTYFLIPNTKPQGLAYPIEFLVKFLLVIKHDQKPKSCICHWDNGIISTKPRKQIKKTRPARYKVLVISSKTFLKSQNILIYWTDHPPPQATEKVLSIQIFMFDETKTMFFLNIRKFLHLIFMHIFSFSITALFIAIMA